MAKFHCEEFLNHYSITGRGSWLRRVEGNVLVLMRMTVCRTQHLSSVDESQVSRQERAVPAGTNGLRCGSGR